MVPQTVSNNSNQNKITRNEIFRNLSNLATQLQTLGQPAFQQIVQKVISPPTPTQGSSGTANSSSRQSAFGLLNPNMTIPEELKQEVLSGEFFVN